MRACASECVRTHSDWGEGEGVRVKKEVGGGARVGEGEVSGEEAIEHASVVAYGGSSVGVSCGRCNAPDLSGGREGTGWGEERERSPHTGENGRGGAERGKWQWKTRRQRGHKERNPKCTRWKREVYVSVCVCVGAETQ